MNHPEADRTEIYGPRPLPAVPTTAAPGTPEKLAVMDARCQRLECLCHPYDARYPGDARTIEFLRMNDSEKKVALAKEAVARTQKISRFFQSLFDRIKPYET